MRLNITEVFFYLSCVYIRWSKQVFVSNSKFKILSDIHIHGFCLLYSSWFHYVPSYVSYGNHCET